MKKTSQTIDNILQKASQLAYILQHVTILRQLNEQWLKLLLPEELKEHCQALCYQQQKLVLGVDDPVWLTQLHHYKLDLLKELREPTILPELRQIKLTVIPTFSLHIASYEKTRPILPSKAAAKNLQFTAKYIKHERLQEALNKLATLINQYNQ